MATVSGSKADDERYGLTFSDLDGLVHDKAAKEEHSRGSLDWVLADPQRALKMFIMLMLAILSLLWLFLYFTWDHGVTFGVFGFLLVVSSIYVASSFRTLLALQKQVERISTCTHGLEKSIHELHHTLTNIIAREKELRATNDALTIETEQFKSCLTELDEVQSGLSKVSARNESGVEQMQELSERMEEQWRNQLEDSENNIFVELHEFFSQKKTECSLPEWRQVLEHLPADYKEHWQQFGGDEQFDTHARDDQMMDMTELRYLLNRWVHNFLVEKKCGKVKADDCKDDE